MKRWIYKKKKIKNERKEEKLKEEIKIKINTPTNIKCMFIGKSARHGSTCTYNTHIVNALIGRAAVAAAVYRHE